ncbi:MAG: chemotaxis-specific protein-glutamate methyltransferase CheB [Oscillospiraceae bacterium]|nr:chemotaxis-specific protein-glutamate methyltransferase CheB [Oscillospiraceae bacterium]
MKDVRRRIKVLIVDDSLPFRNMICAELAKDRDIEVVAQASDPYEARHKIMLFDPDVMVLDVILPKMDGVEFIRRLMAQYPIPVIVISSVKEYVIKAVQAGAVEGLEKPRGDGENSISSFIKQLSDKIRLAYSGGRMNGAHASAAQGQAVHGQVAQGSSALGQAAQGQAAQGSAVQGSAGVGAAGAGLAGAGASARKSAIEFIAIGASTGGTNAIADIMTALPAGLPGIIIVQHMPADFTGMFAKRLHSSCAMSVFEAKSGDRILPSTALVAPGSYHLRIAKTGDSYSVLVQPGDKVNGHCPSVDVMFSSAAETAKGKAIGVLLTGMGQDGAKGLLEMRKAGAKTIGQDEKSSVVYGMPKVAYDIGAVGYQLPLNQIASRIIALL